MHRITASALAHTDPATAAARILAPEGLSQWFRDATVRSADPAWPAAGSRMAWVVGRGRWAFEARVVEDRRPHFVRLAVRTPSGASTITHRFDPEQGGTRYTKEVHLGAGSGLLAVLLARWLQREVRREVARAAAMASRPRAAAQD